MVVFRFPGEIRARYFDYGYGGGLRGSEFELVGRSGLGALRGTRMMRNFCGLRGTCGMRGTWVLRRICCLSFHQERETTAFFGNVLDDFCFALPDNACVKAPAFAINVFVNLNAVFDAHAECDIRIFADAVEFLADMRTVEIQFENAAV